MKHSGCSLLTSSLPLEGVCSFPSHEAARFRLALEPLPDTLATIEHRPYGSQFRNSLRGARSLEGPSTQYLTPLVRKTIKNMVLDQSDSVKIEPKVSKTTASSATRNRSREPMTNN